jgi:SAM-dependent methyltransferase
MATLDLLLLPATTYCPPSAAQARKTQRSLNTIMEDEVTSQRNSMIMMNRQSQAYEKASRTAEWLSPMSDNFPTPRGNHFMSAPIAESTASESEESIISGTSGTPSSAPWTRTSFTTEATDFDDLYDVSSDDEARRKPSVRRRSATRQTSRSSSRQSVDSRTSRKSLPVLAIPSQGDPWPGHEAFKALTSPIPPTPPPKVPMSPALFQYLQSQEVPSCSAPPSLDGSLSSDQLAVMSVPPTPEIGSVVGDDEDVWGNGIQLQPAALATLQALSGNDSLYEHQPEQVIELPHAPAPAPRVQEMQQSLPPLTTNIHRNNSIILSPENQRSLNSLTRLEIPSPGGFFSTLSRNARHTWHLVPLTPEVDAPPTSTTAENFYKTPWSSGAPVESILEVAESDCMSNGLPTAPITARYAPLQEPIVTSTAENFYNTPWSSSVPVQQTIFANNSDCMSQGLPTAKYAPIQEEIVADEIITETLKLDSVAVETVDRTGLWLAAQSSYLSNIVDPVEERDDEVALLKRHASVKIQRESFVEVEDDVPPMPTQIRADSRSEARKTVRFSVIPPTPCTGVVACPLPQTDLPQESAYYRAFQSFKARSRARDTFSHRIPRFEALQTQRVVFPDAHRAQLLGKYQLSTVHMSPKKRESANVARGDETPPANLERMKKNREHEAFEQMKHATWNVMASRLLNGGRLIAAPAAKKLSRLSSMGPKLYGASPDRARILDLGGQATCDWAWHVAAEYPNIKVYTVTTKALRQLSNSNIRGPKNHRQVAVDRLTVLPFKDNQFDLISAREIYSILKSKGENGQDEWDACLAECHRVLKPGGYLEFSIMDSDIVNAGPLGLAKSVEFGFNLTTLGFDASPTKTFLPRLKQAGFVGVKRAWTFLPMGAKLEEAPKNRDSLGVEVKLQMDAFLEGSLESMACVGGIVGGWAWEKWLLRCKLQTFGNEAKIDGVRDIIEEGRYCGAGWRTVNGWAMKPLR